ncbi:DUF418 domain-containing protein [Massilia endophytica]|uniref:DUF418 domain-containing protein n=1 Tax=Massilia endophytica TaxID=2899220 RepID=UPI001E466175|nr:DUF418 domain-containing protein [Massilia endophytica]UGQ48568.1 DUF418 domain-containing protein [Massilia endophytica]
MTKDCQPIPPPLYSAPAGERIQVLDVVRGFALIGVFMMNIDSFNRPTLMNFLGIEAGLTGIDWWWSWFVQYFVTSKFWTIFSMLFGMGFAVMLERANQAGRSFVPSYLRRIAGLLLLGALHVLFFWSGDILIAYGLAAAGLLAALYVRPLYIAALLVLMIGVSETFGLKWAGDEWRPLGFLLAAALYLQQEKRHAVFGLKLHAFPIVMLLGAFAAACALFINTYLDTKPAIPLPVLQVALPAYLICGLAGAVWHERPGRAWRLGVGIYLLSVVFTFGPRVIPMTGYFMSSNEATPAQVQQLQERRVLVDRIAAETLKYNARDAQIKAHGTFKEAAALRIEQAWEYERMIPNSFALGMFLIGFWFVRSGVIGNIPAHLPLFRKLACYALPLGVALSLAGGLFGHTRDFAKLYDPFLYTGVVRNVAALPASLGYMGLVVVLAHGRWRRQLGVLAPLGRMALTNYLTQSVLSSLIFYSHGLGLYGISRGAQILYVLAVLAAQTLFSHWWLARYRYGPAEYLLRALTYWRWPAMRTPAPQTIAA